MGQSGERRLLSCLTAPCIPPSSSRTQHKQNRQGRRYSPVQRTAAAAIDGARPVPSPVHWFASGVFLLQREVSPIQPCSRPQAPWLPSCPARPGDLRSADVLPPICPVGCPAAATRSLFHEVSSEPRVESSAMPPLRPRQWRRQ